MCLSTPDPPEPPPPPPAPPPAPQPVAENVGTPAKIKSNRKKGSTQGPSQLRIPVNRSALNV